MLCQDPQQKSSVHSHRLDIFSWFRYLLKGSPLQVPSPTLIMCENALTLALICNLVHHARTKHIKIDCHFIKDKIKVSDIYPLFVPSNLKLQPCLLKDQVSTLLPSSQVGHL